MLSSSLRGTWPLSVLEHVYRESAADAKCVIDDALSLLCVCVSAVRGVCCSDSSLIHFLCAQRAHFIGRAAVWSFVGHHVFGIGDRHLETILVYIQSTDPVPVGVFVLPEALYWLTVCVCIAARLGERHDVAHVPRHRR